MLKYNRLINYTLDFWSDFILFCFDQKKGLIIKMEYPKILLEYVP